MKKSLNEILSLMDRIDPSFILTEAVDPEVIYERYYSDIPKEHFYNLIKSDNLSKFDENGKLTFISPNAKWLLKMYKKDENVRKIASSKNTDATSDILDTYNEFLDSKKRYSKSLRELKKNYKKLSSEGDLENKTVQKHIKDFERRIKQAEDNIPDVKDSIMDYTDYDELVGSISSNVGKELRQSDKEVKRKGADVIFNDGEYMVVHTTTRAANQLYGKGAVWCTTMRDEDYYWNSYSKKGNLYIIRNLNNPEDLHQLFVSNSGFVDEFRDIGNESILDSDWFSAFSNDDELISFIMELTWNIYEEKQVDTEKDFEENKEVILRDEKYLVYRKKGENLFKIYVSSAGMLWPIFDDVKFPDNIDNYMIGNICEKNIDFNSIIEYAYDANFLPTESFVNSEYQEEVYGEDCDYGYCLINLDDGELITPDYIATSCEENGNSFIFRSSYSMDGISIFDSLSGKFATMENNDYFDFSDLTSLEGYAIVGKKLYDEKGAKTKKSIYDLTKCEFLNIDGTEIFDSVTTTDGQESYTDNEYIGPLYVEVIIGDNLYYFDKDLHPIKADENSKRKVFDAKISHRLTSKEGKTYAVIKDQDGRGVSLYDYDTMQVITINGESLFKKIVSVNHFEKSGVLAFTDFVGNIEIVNMDRKKTVTINGIYKFTFCGGWASNDLCFTFLRDPNNDYITYIYIPELDRVIESNGENRIELTSTLSWFRSKNSDNPVTSHSVLLKFKNNDFAILTNLKQLVKDCIENRRLDSNVLPEITYRTTELGENNVFMELFNTNESLFNVEGRLEMAIFESQRGGQQENNESKKYIKDIINEELRKRFK